MVLMITCQLALFGGDVYNARYKGRRLGRSPWGLHETQTESTGFIKAFISFSKIMKLVCIFSYYNK
jgi:hypothetical protein